MSKRQRTYRIPKLFHPMTFIDKLEKFNELGKLFQLMDHQAKFWVLPSPSIRTAACRGIRSFRAASRRAAKPR